MKSSFHASENEWKYAEVFIQKNISIFKWTNVQLEVWHGSLIDVTTHWNKVIDIKITKHESQNDKSLLPNSLHLPFNASFRLLFRMLMLLIQSLFFQESFIFDKFLDYLGLTADSIGI